MSEGARISSARVSVLTIPLERSKVGAHGRRTTEYKIVLARVRTADGVEGVGYFVSQRSELGDAIGVASRELAELVIGASVLEIEAAWERLAGAGSWVGPGGMLHWAIAPLDIAIWDAAGKTLGQPVYRLLGGYRNRIRAYATDGFSADRSLDELARAAQEARDAGFGGLKFRTSPRRRAREEVERFRVLRAAAGPDMMILVEAGQSWDVPRALDTGHALEEAGAHWIEDPIPSGNVDGLAEIARRLRVPIAGGENLYTLDEFKRFLSEKAVDVPIVDLGRIGGITPWMKVAALAQALHLPVCGHVLSEIHVHPLAAVPNGYLVEYAPRAEAILTASAKLERGELIAPERPGLGLELDEAAVAKYARA